MYVGQKTVFPDIDFCRYQDTEWGKSVNFQQVLKVSQILYMKTVSKDRTKQNPTANNNMIMTAQHKCSVQ